MMFLFVLIFSSPIPGLFIKSCTERCQRIHNRSLDRVGFDGEKLLVLLQKQRPLGALKDVCWRAYDHLDCMRRCDHSDDHEKFAKMVRAKCRFVLQDIEESLNCISRYHSFIEIRCSTFLKEAKRRREITGPDLVPDRETCRYLHLNSLCLENTVGGYCSNAVKIFRRLNFRDYFLNFILPENDSVFDDMDLNSCQIFNFVRKEVHVDEIDEELTTLLDKWEGELLSTSPMTPFLSSSTERKEFTALINEMLESSTEENEVTKSSKEITQSTPSLENERKKRPIVTSTWAFPTIAESSTKIPTTQETTSITSNKVLYETTEMDDESDDITDYSEFNNGDNDGSNISIVLIKNHNKISEDNKSEISTTHQTPTRRKLFSDDSWEQTPPNFHYSSFRAYQNGGVTPLLIDTSTVFGIEDSSSSTEQTADDNLMTTQDVPRKKKPDRMLLIINASISSPYDGRNQSELNTTTTSVLFSTTTTSFASQMAPILNGSVIIKPIRKWNEEESMEYAGILLEENESLYDTTTIEGNGGETEHSKGNIKPIHNSFEDSFKYSPINRTSHFNFDWTSKETLVLLYCLLFSIALFSMMCILVFCIWCRKRGSAHITKPYY